MIFIFSCLLSVHVPVFADVFTCERRGQRSVWVIFLSGSLPESGAHRLDWAGQTSEPRNCPVPIFPAPRLQSCTAVSTGDQNSDSGTYVASILLTELLPEPLVFFHRGIGDRHSIFVVMKLRITEYTKHSIKHVMGS